MENTLKIAKYLRYIARTILLITASFWFMFGLLSGTEYDGQGVKGLLMNLPNTIPWVLLFIFVYIAWKKELIGGVILVLTGLFTIYFFDAFKSAFVMLIMSLPLIILGGFLITSWKLRRKTPAPV